MSEIESVDLKTFRTEDRNSLLAIANCKGMYALHPAPPNGANIKWVLKKGMEDPSLTPWFVVCLMFDDLRLSKREYQANYLNPGFNRAHGSPQKNLADFAPVNIMTDLRRWAMIDYPENRWFSSNYFLVQIKRDELLEPHVAALGPRDVEIIRADCEQFVDSLQEPQK